MKTMAMAAMEMDKLEKECFKKGAEVEVSLEEPDFRGSWYTATVIRTVYKKTRRIFLEFHNLKADDKCSKPLRENVNIILVRPFSPRESTRRRFQFSEEVDAFHNDGWWEGVVIAVHNCGDSYSFFFRSSREQIDFLQSELRLHREWVYRKWVPPLEQEQDREEEAELEIPSQ